MKSPLPRVTVRTSLSADGRLLEPGNAVLVAGRTRLTISSPAAFEAALRDLADRGIRRVACDGGGKHTGWLLALDCLHEIQVTIRPRILGGANAETLTGLDLGFLPHSVRLKRISLKVSGGNCVARFRVIR